MRKTTKFDAFGRTYRTTQFAAIPGLVIMDKQAELTPLDVLSGTEALGYDDNWYRLDSRENINSLVTDAAGVLPPRAILDALCKLINEFNFAFLATWKGAKVPRRFTSGATSVESKNVDPIIMTLIQEDVAKLRDLEEYYSLEDAFKMFDILVVKGINSALQHEQAERDAKAKRR